MNRVELKRRLYRIWCWWRLYSRLTVRILYHTGKTPVASGMMIGNANGIYPFFEASVWLFFILIPFGKLLSAANWIIFCFLIGTIIMFRDWRKWDSNEEVLKDCNELREQGFWFPDWMVSGPGRQLMICTFGGVLQMILTAVFVFVGLVYLR